MLAGFLSGKYKLWEDFWSCDVSVPINPNEARVNCTDTWGTRFMIPVGFAGLRWFVNTWDLRFRVKRCREAH